MNELILATLAASTALTSTIAYAQDVAPQAGPRHAQLVPAGASS